MGTSYSVQSIVVALGETLLAWTVECPAVDCVVAEVEVGAIVEQ